MIPKIIGFHGPYGSGKDWLWSDPSLLSTVCPHVTKVWTQIANAFIDYSTDLLAFEGYNELMPYARTWAVPTQAEYDALLTIGQTFVNAVRATGGNNLNRVLSVNTYAAGLSNGHMYRLPTDVSIGCLMVQIHIYDSRTNQEVEDDLSKADLYFGSKNIPLIVGECGVYVGATYKYRILAARNFSARVKAHGYRCFWWDTKDDYQLLERETLTWKFDAVASAMIEGFNNYVPNNDVYAERFVLNNPSDFNYTALNKTTGLPSTIALGSISLKNKIAVQPYCKYVIAINKTGLGQRFNGLFWYDENQAYVGCKYTGDSEQTTVIVPYNARYFNLYVYNPWNTYSFSTFSSLMTSGDLALEVRYVDKQPTEEDLLRYNIDTFNFNNISNWKTGFYNILNCSYETDASKISVIGYIACESDTDYKITISNPNIGVIIKECDIQKDSAYEHAYCVNGMYFSTSFKTRYLYMSLYMVDGSVVDFNYFVQQFANGLTVNIAKQSNPETTNDIFNLSTINFSNIANYKTGEYSGGKFQNFWYKDYLMCVSHPIEIVPSSLYMPTMTTGFIWYFTELNANKEVIRGISGIKNNSYFVTSPNAKYLLAVLCFYNPSLYADIKTKTSIDFINSIRNNQFNCSVGISALKAMSLKTTNGTLGYALSSAGVSYISGDSNFCLFHYIDVSTITQRDIVIYPSTGGVYLAQYDVSGVCLGNATATQYTGSNVVTLNTLTTKIRFFCTWMNSASTIIIAYSANTDITYI